MEFTKKVVAIAGVLAILFNLPQTTGASKILTVAPFFGKSHAKFIHAVNLHLAKKGHDVTVLTSNLIKNPPPNYHQIFVDLDNVVKEMDASIDYWALRNQSTVDHLLRNLKYNEEMPPKILSLSNVRDFIENDKTKFDLVIVEMFGLESMYMFVHKYKTPLVLIDTTFPKSKVEQSMGNPLPACYVPFEISSAAGMISTSERAFNWFIKMFDFLTRIFISYPKQNEIASKYFESLPGPLPKVEDLEKTASLILVNTHFSFDVVYPLVPGIVQIAGAHIEEVKKLPQDIQKFLDEAKDGVIFFSLGSHVKSSTMPKYKLDAFLNNFKTLKQRVLWKWEDDNPPKLNNILTKKWLPQNDILAHPNVKVFINHGGMLSVQESIDKAVPIIGIPLFFDQFNNIAKLVQLGNAIELDFLSINEETVKNALDKVFNDTSYQHKAKELARKFKDRQNHPLDTAAYWVEYVINHKGARFLKSPYVHLKWYEKYMVDVILVAFLALALVLGVVLFLFKQLKKCITVKKSKKLNKKTKTN